MMINATNAEALLVHYHCIKWYPNDITLAILSLNGHVCKPHKSLCVCEQEEYRDSIG